MLIVSHNIIIAIHNLGYQMNFFFDQSIERTLPHKDNIYADNFLSIIDELVPSPFNLENDLFSSLVQPKGIQWTPYPLR